MRHLTLQPTVPPGTSDNLMETLPVIETGTAGMKCNEALAASHKLLNRLFRGISPEMPLVPRLRPVSDQHIVPGNRRCIELRWGFGDIHLDPSAILIGLRQ